MNKENKLQNEVKTDNIVCNSLENSIEHRISNPRKTSKPSDNAPSKLAPSRKRRTVVPKWKQKRLGVKNANPDLHYHLANDEDGNIDKMILAGYDPVTNDTEDNLRGIHSGHQEGALATQDVGNGTKAIWMAMPREQWEELQREKAKQNNFVDEQLYMKNIVTRQDPNAFNDKRYYLKDENGEIKIK